MNTWGEVGGPWTSIELQVCVWLRDKMGKLPLIKNDIFHVTYQQCHPVSVAQRACCGARYPGAAELCEE